MTTPTGPKISSCATLIDASTSANNVGEKNQQWNAIPVRGGELFNFDPASTYIQEPPFFIDLKKNPDPIQPIHAARVRYSRELVVKP